MLVADQFEYIGPEDLTEYNVRRTEIRADQDQDQDTAIRVQVTTAASQTVAGHRFRCCC